MQCNAFPEDADAKTRLKRRFAFSYPAVNKGENSLVCVLRGGGGRRERVREEGRGREGRIK